MKIVTIVGARPQFIKSSIVSKKLKEKGIEEIYIHTGQHYDKNMSDIFFEELNIDKPKYNLCIGSGTHGEQTGNMIVEIEKILLQEKPNGILLYGDTNSTLAGAIAGSKLYIPIFHVEGGVRLHLANPEEINRILTDNVSTLIFTPTSEGIVELSKEGLGERGINSGDVMLDRLLSLQDKLNINDHFFYENKLKREEYYILTLHRPENVDNRERLKKILEILNKLEKKVLFLTHPRTKNKIKEFNLSMKDYENIDFREPVGYEKLMKYIKYSSGVLTDSGGLQKEACFLGKKCINIYKNTPWKELKLIEAIFVWNNLEEEALKSELKKKIDLKDILSIFGNGKASEVISNSIYDYLKG